MAKRKKSVMYVVEVKYANQGQKDMNEATLRQLMGVFKSSCELNHKNNHVRLIEQETLPEMA